MKARRCVTVIFTSVLLFLTAVFARASVDPVAASQSDIVILLHGLGRGKTAMWSLGARLKAAGYQVERIGYSSLSQSPEEIVTQVAQQINACCQNVAPRVHFVGHSLGGLVIRAYLQDHSVEHLGRVVLIGTPNQGSEFVERYQDRWWLKLLGPTTLALGTGANSFVASLLPPNYPVGVIAGIKASNNDSYLPGDDDGLVAIEATKLEGMSDFSVVKSSHSFMRYDDEVARLAISFLKSGVFEEVQP